MAVIGFLLHLTIILASATLLGLIFVVVLDRKLNGKVLDDCREVLDRMKEKILEDIERRGS